MTTRQTTHCWSWFEHNNQLKSPKRHLPLSSSFSCTEAPQRLSLLCFALALSMLSESLRRRLATTEPPASDPKAPSLPLRHRTKFLSPLGFDFSLSSGLSFSVLFPSFFGWVLSFLQFWHCCLVNDYFQFYGFFYMSLVNEGKRFLVTLFVFFEIGEKVCENTYNVV